MALAAAASPAVDVAATFSLSLRLRHRLHRVTTVACSLPRYRRENPSATAARGSPDPSDDALVASLWRLRRRAELRLHRLLADADDAYRDLRSAARVVGGDRVVVTFRRSSLRFAAAALLWSLALAAAAGALVVLGLGFWLRRRRRRRSRGEGGAVVRRRDRSLGGREVVVGVASFGAAPVNQVSQPARQVRRREQQVRLPEWWPEVSSEVVLTGPEVEAWGRQANRLVRAIIDNRITGRDYRYDDAIQLRQLCKISGVKVSFDTVNARDSFYRAAINFILDDFSRAVQDEKAAQINGEHPRIFLAGLASNVELDKFRAATLVRASVAARTRACFLQCWALEIQGKQPEALEELLKICRFHSMFPPEENSAEMEMVAGGLRKNLQVVERVHLLSLYRGVCSAGNFRTAAEALGLSSWDQ